MLKMNKQKGKMQKKKIRCLCKVPLLPVSFVPLGLGMLGV